MKMKSLFPMYNLSIIWVTTQPLALSRILLVRKSKAKNDELIQVYGNVLQQFNEIAEEIY